VTKRLEDPSWDSIYGKSDVFTAAWLLTMYDRAVDQAAWPSTFKKTVVSIITNALSDSKTKQPDVDRSLFPVGRDNEAGAHPLPLLKAIRSLKIIKTHAELNQHWSLGSYPSPDEVMSAAGRWFERNLHRQMSFYQFEDFRFDAAELVFCLSGAIETFAINQREPIIPKVMAIIVGAQKRSVYWRPYRPMLADPQGKVLLPLSIEVATALLKTLQDTGLFHDFRSTLQTYCDWLTSQKVDYPCPHSRAAGWHSENAYETPRIHVWDTSLIATFFAEYLDTLEKDIQCQIKAVSSFIVEEPNKLRISLSKMTAFDLGLGKDKTIKDAISRDFPESNKRDGQRAYSLLLYGPPGTAKTTLAKGIAGQLKYDLIYLSPSNFISQGESGIEEQARDVFRALMALKHCVILFDEIDRLVLDRESEPYGKQGEMFQFMTPGMLVRLNDLRKLEQCVFIISTNFAERIDKAIKRQGRIDRTILCLPFDLASRSDVLRQLILHRFAEATDADEQKLVFPAGQTSESESVARRYYLYVYEELDRVVRDALPSDSVKDLDTFCNQMLSTLKTAAVAAPQISLKSYPPRLKSESGYPQRPYEEYLSLILLQLESVHDLEWEREFKARIKEWEAHDVQEYAARRQELRKRAVAYGKGGLLDAK
jgi:AAA+ superfamily predicted ATPase